MSSQTKEICTHTGMWVLRRDGKVFHSDDTCCLGRNGRIIQIVGSQPNWSAVYLSNGVESRRPIACWALVENCNGDTRVAGIDPASFGDGNVESRVGFSHYCGEPSLEAVV